MSQYKALLTVVPSTNVPVVNRLAKCFVAAASVQLSNSRHCRHHLPVFLTAVVSATADIPVSFGC